MIVPVELVCGLATALDTESSHPGIEQAESAEPKHRLNAARVRLNLSFPTETAPRRGLREQLRSQGRVLVQLSDTAVTMAAVIVTAETVINIADSTTKSAMTGLITVR